MKKTFTGSNIILLTIFISFLFSPFDKLITNLNANQGNKSQQFYESIEKPIQNMLTIYEKESNNSLSKSASLINSIPSSIAIDHLGYIYIVGKAGNPYYFNSTYDFLCINSSIKGFSTRYNGGGSDGFLIKLDPTGTEVVYGTFIGGHDDDLVQTIAVDNKGNAYIAGQTRSDAASFPIGGSIPGFQTELNGKSDGFIMKINTLDNRVEYATYLGGNGNDTITSIAIDEDGNAYVGGVTFSDPETFPVKTSIPGFQKEKGAMRSGFAAKLDPTGTHLLYSTYIGGNKGDDITSIALDQDNNLYIGGYTYSTEDSFPIGGDIPGFSTSHKGGTDGFILKLNHDGTEVLYSTYLGGSNLIGIYSIAIDHYGSVYATGFANLAPHSRMRSFTEFPIGDDIPGYNTIYHSYGAFLAKLNPQGTDLEYSTYIATSGALWGNAVVVDKNGNAYVLAYATNSNMPTHLLIPSIEPQYKGKGDVFLVKFDASGTLLNHASYIGGTNEDIPISMTLSPNDKLLIAGSTLSNKADDFPIGGDIPGYNKNFDPANTMFVLGINIDEPAIFFSTSLTNIFDD